MKHDPVYDKIDNMKYRILETYDTDIGIIPPGGKDIKTPFGLLSGNGVLTKEKGFCLDGATYAIDTPTIIGPAANHDWGCSAVNRGDLPIEYRALFDKNFKKECAENGIPNIRVEWLGDAVSAYGKTVTPLRMRLKKNFKWLARFMP